MTPIWHSVLVGVLVLAAICFAGLVYAFCKAGSEALDLEREDEK